MVAGQAIRSLNCCYAVRRRGVSCVGEGGGRGRVIR